jgi:hypothetical protein
MTIDLVANDGDWSVGWDMSGCSVERSGCIVAVFSERPDEYATTVSQDDPRVFIDRSNGHPTTRAAWEAGIAIADKWTADRAAADTTQGQLFGAGS